MAIHVDKIKDIAEMGKMEDYARRVMWMYPQIQRVPFIGANSNAVYSPSTVKTTDGVYLYSSKSPLIPYSYDLQAMYASTWMGRKEFLKDDIKYNNSTTVDFVVNGVPVPYTTFEEPYRDGTRCSAMDAFVTKAQNIASNQDASVVREMNLVSSASCGTWGFTEPGSGDREWGWRMSAVNWTEETTGTITASVNASNKIAYRETVSHNLVEMDATLGNLFTCCQMGDEIQPVNFTKSRPEDGKVEYNVYPRSIGGDIYWDPSDGPWISDFYVSIDADGGYHGQNYGCLTINYRLPTKVWISNFTPYRVSITVPVHRYNWYPGGRAETLLSTWHYTDAEKTTKVAYGLNQTFYDFGTGVHPGATTTTWTLDPYDTQMFIQISMSDILRTDLTDNFADWGIGGKDRNGNIVSSPYACGVYGFWIDWREAFVRRVDG